MNQTNWYAKTTEILLMTTRIQYGTSDDILQDEVLKIKIKHISIIRHNGTQKCTAQ
jgi:hypothetical protein